MTEQNLQRELDVAIRQAQQAGAAILGCYRTGRAGCRGLVASNGQAHPQIVAALAPLLDEVQK